ncbi:MAG TPA: urease accessory protein UreF [Abditibacterium sp.]|jgi:urease accessory protein
MPSSSYLQHAQILDSALPIGAFSHSFGLETFVVQDEIRSVHQLEEFLRGALYGAWSSCDALQIKAVWTLNEPQIWELDALLDASRVSRETREGMRKMGRQALKLARAIHPHLDFSPLEVAVQNEKCIGSWPLVYGWWTRGLGIELDVSATGYLYGCCASSVNNAVRLSVVGQTAAQKLLASFTDEIEVAWKNVEARDPFDFSSALPALEIAQMQHEWLDSRLFMS